jgi:hypothetical protein
VKQRVPMFLDHIIGMNVIHYPDDKIDRVKNLAKIIRKKQSKNHKKIEKSKGFNSVDNGGI